MSSKQHFAYRSFWRIKKHEQKARVPSEKLNLFEINSFSRLNNYMKVIWCLLWIFTGHCVFAEKWTLCKKGQPNAVVVVAANATTQEQYAAEELCRFLKLATDADFLKTNEPSRQNGIVNLYVGGQGNAIYNLGRDGILIRNLPDGILLTGSPPRGTLYAVFTFLEDQIGFRFWSGRQIAYPLGTDGKRNAPIIIDDAEMLIPEMHQELTVTVANLDYTPPFELREPYWGTNLNDPDWCIRNKVIGRISKTGGEKTSIYGGNINIIGHIQSFWYWLPPKKYFANHPEYYSLIDGKRNWKNPKGKLWADRQTQLCMTNPAVANEIAKLMLKRLQNHKNKIDGLSIAPNDWNNPCQCAECRAVYEREGSPSGALLLLVNRIAEQVHREFPDVEIHTGAYMWYQKPPRSIRPGSKVVVWFVTQGMNLCEKYESDRNHEILNRLKGWAQVVGSGKLYVWDHGANWEHYLVPFPDIHRWQSTMRLYRDLGVKGVWFLGPYSMPNMEFATMRNWMMSKLCWNPSLDVNKLMRRFLDEYYGDAAPWIEKYIAGYQQAYLKSGQSFDKWRWSPLSNCRFLSPEMLLKYNHWIEQAESAVKGNPDLERRVMRIRLSLWYLFLLRYDEFKSALTILNEPWPFPQGMAKLLDDFNAVLPKLGILYFAERGRSYWPAITERASLPEALPIPPGCEKMIPDHWTMLTAANFTIPANASGKFVTDAEAPSGVALKIQPEAEEPLYRRAMWNIPLHILARNKGLNVRVKLLLKGDFLECKGYLQHRNNRLEVKIANVPDGKYYWYDLGEIQSAWDWIHLWVKIPNNPAIRTVSLGAIALILSEKTMPLKDEK